MPPQFVASSQIPVAQCEVGRSCSHWQLQLVHTRALSLLSLSKSPTSWARHRTFKLLARWRGPRSRPALEATDAAGGRTAQADLLRSALPAKALLGTPGRPGPTSMHVAPGPGSCGGPAATVARRRGRGGHGVAVLGVGLRPSGSRLGCGPRPDATAVVPELGDGPPHEHRRAAAAPP